MNLYLQPADGVGLIHPAGGQQKRYQQHQAQHPHPPTHVPPSVGPLHAPNIVTIRNITADIYEDVFLYFKVSLQYFSL